MQYKTMSEPRLEIEKIKKLLTLSSSQNDADAAAALGQALELLSRHGLDPNEVQDDSPFEIKDLILSDSLKRESPWKSVFVNSIVRAIGGFIFKFRKVTSSSHESIYRIIARSQQADYVEEILVLGLRYISYLRKKFYLSIKHHYYGKNKGKALNSQADEYCLRVVAVALLKIENLLQSRPMKEAGVAAKAWAEHYFGRFKEKKIRIGSHDEFLLFLNAEGLLYFNELDR